MNYLNELENLSVDSEKIKNQLNEYCSSITKRIENTLNYFEKSQSSNNDIKSNYEKTIEQMNLNHSSIVSDLKNTITDLQSRNKDLLDEMTSLKKVSLLGAMNKQLHEKDIMIEMLQKKIESLKIKLNTSDTPPLSKTPIHMEPFTKKTNIVEITIVNTEKSIQDLTEESIEYEQQADTEQDDEVVEEEQQEDEVQDDVVKEDEDELQVEEEVEVQEEEQVEEEQVEEEDDEQDEEDDIEYEVKKIGKKYYYISNEEPMGIYIVIKETNEVGDKVGEYNGDKPKFYN